MYSSIGQPCGRWSTDIAPRLHLRFDWMPDSIVCAQHCSGQISYNGHLSPNAYAWYQGLSTHDPTSLISGIIFYHAALVNTSLLISYTWWYLHDFAIRSVTVSACMVSGLYCLLLSLLSFHRSFIIYIEINWLYVNGEICIILICQISFAITQNLLDNKVAKTAKNSHTWSF